MREAQRRLVLAGCRRRGRETLEPLVRAAMANGTLVLRISALRGVEKNLSGRLQWLAYQ
jgi:hypothetical protein